MLPPPFSWLSGILPLELTGHTSSRLHFCTVSNLEIAWAVLFRTGGLGPPGKGELPWLCLRPHGAPSRSPTEPHHRLRRPWPLVLLQGGSRAEAAWQSRPSSPCEAALPWGRARRGLGRAGGQGKGIPLTFPVLDQFNGASDHSDLIFHFQYHNQRPMLPAAQARSGAAPGRLPRRD